MSPSPFRRLADTLRYAADPVAFAIERLGFNPDPWQAEVLTSPARQQLLNCTRQAGKSSVAAVKALHVALYTEGALIIVIAPSLRQSRELFGKVVDFLKTLSPVQVLEEDNRLSLRLANGSRIVALPGDPKTVRGFSAPALIIEDEAAYLLDETHTAIRPMLATSGGQLILMSTPRGRRGHFFEYWQNGGPGWARISVLAAECPRISKEFLESELAALGEWRFKQEYGCAFVETEDSLFQYDLIQSAFSDEILPLFTPAEFAALTGGAR